MDKRITGETGCLRYLARQTGGGFWYHKRISRQDRKRKNEAVKGTSGTVSYTHLDGDLAVLSGSNQFSVSDKVIRGGVKIQKRDLETGDTKPQGSATLKDTAFDIISLNDNYVLVEGK